VLGALVIGPFASRRRFGSIDTCARLVFSAGGMGHLSVQTWSSIKWNGLHGARSSARTGYIGSGTTFCSHLAMRGAPARAIQELAGHQDLTTTQRYMHLSPAAIEGAIRLLDHPKTARGRGDMLDTGNAASDYSNR
jgi:site-specific recombinase XerD